MTEAPDIVERLRLNERMRRELASETAGERRDYLLEEARLNAEAAAEITRLRAALAARTEECAKVAEEMAVLAQSLASATENNHMRYQRIAESAQSLSIAAAIRSITP